MRLFYVLLIVALLTFSAVAEDIAVTVYNNNLGVVSETRSLEFDRGVNRIAFTNVPSGIDPASVRFEVLGGGGNITILEQNYAYDLVGVGQMYAKYIDQDIELINIYGEVYTGALLSHDPMGFSNPGAVILRDNSGRIKIVSLKYVAELNFPKLPEGLISRPALFWVYNSDTQGKLDTRVGYQTSGMNWTAEYVGVLDGNEKNLDLSGWASINNTSGKTYEDATLKLIAGDVHRRAPEVFIRGGRAADVGYVTSGAPTGFEEKAFFEYHLYTLPRKATLADKQTKQISLFEPASSKVEKVFIFRPEKNAKKVEVAIKFKNSEETGLGMPLPAGRIRLFKADDDGSLIMLGEDRIDHTPKDEEVKAQVGYAFDITAEQKLANQTRLSSGADEKDFEIKLSNHKTEAVTVEIEKKLTGYWDIIASSLVFEKKDATTVEFKVPLEPDETKIVKFKVRYYR